MPKAAPKTSAAQAQSEEAPKAGAPADAEPAAKPAEPAAAEKPAADAPTKADAPAGGTNTKTVDIDPAAPPAVTLLSAGTDPKPLRLAPTAGSTERLSMTMATTVKMKMGEAEAPAVEAPPVVAVIATTVDGVEGDLIDATFAYESMSVDDSKGGNPMMVQQMKTMLEGFEAFRGSLKLDNRGALKGGSVDVPQSLPAPMQQMVNQLQQSVAQMQVPLPADAVGVGGSWKAETTLDQNGMKLKQFVTYAVLERSGNTVKLSTKVEQELLDKSFTPPGMAGVTATIDNYRGGGEGTLTLDLGQVMPTASEMTVDVAMDMEIEMAGQKQSQSMEMKLAVTMAEVK